MRFMISVALLVCSVASNVNHACAYVLCIVMSLLCLPYLSLLRPAVLVALLSVLLAVKPIRLVARGATGQELIAVLGATGKLQMLFGVLLSVGLAIGI